MTDLDTEIGKLVEEAKKKEGPPAIAGPAIQRRTECFVFSYGWLADAVTKVTYEDGTVGDFVSHKFLVRDNATGEEWVFHFTEPDKRNLLEKMTGGVVLAE